MNGVGGEGRKTGKTDENAIAIVQTMGAQTGLTPMGISLCSKRPRPCKNMVVPTLLRDFPQLHLNISMFEREMAPPITGCGLQRR